jgi:hypothetical protein
MWSLKIGEWIPLIAAKKIRGEFGNSISNYN